MITALSYLGVHSDRLDAWRRFATELLGMEVLDSGGNSSSFRMDNQAQRLFVSDANDSSIIVGWEVEKKEHLDFFAAKLETAGHAVLKGTSAESDQRLVGEMISFSDPAGTRVELVWKPEKAGESLKPGRPIQGFKTGPLGMGHVVFQAKEPELLATFYADMLGFRLSDYGKKPIPLFFFHVNGRHHSLAIVGSNRNGLHHLMVEYENLDDVGQGYDLAMTGKAEVAYTLGRHTNDFMTSFYVHSPSGFFIESGWGGRIIEPDLWVSDETTLGPSFWGHERLYLNEKERLAFRKMRMDAAASGHRAPAIKDCPWLFDGGLES